jgi:hypothetical protein
VLVAVPQAARGCRLESGHAVTATCYNKYINKKVEVCHGKYPSAF